MRFEFNPTEAPIDTSTDTYRSHDTSEIPTVAERLRRLIEIARRRWLILLLVPGVAAAAAAAVASGAAKEYHATAKVLLSDAPIVDHAEPGESSSPADPERDINTKIELIRLGTVADRVQSRLGLHVSQEALVGKVSATPEGTTNIVDVTATDARPARAAAIANGFADEYVAFRGRIARSTLREAAEGVRRQLASLGPSDVSSARATALRSRLQELETESAVQTGGAKVVLNAAVPTSPTGPRLMMAAVLGAVIGFTLALLIVAVLELMGPTPAERRRRETEDDLESLFLAIERSDPEIRGT
jgi:uncharacterized protein involved in exopolysaccharide biosynthesis